MGRIHDYLNSTHAEHAAFALAYQVPTGLLTGDWWWAGAVPVAFFVAREHAQREYQITKGGPVGGLKWHEGFFGWSKDSILDVVAPAVACVAAALLRTLL